MFPQSSMEYIFGGKKSLDEAHSIARHGTDSGTFQPRDTSSLTNHTAYSSSLTSESASSFMEMNLRGECAHVNGSGCDRAANGNVFEAHDPEETEDSSHGESRNQHVIPEAMLPVVTKSLELGSLDTFSEIGSSRSKSMTHHPSTTKSLLDTQHGNSSYQNQLKSITDHRYMGSLDTQHGSNGFQNQLNSVTQHRNMGSLDTQHGSNSYQNQLNSVTQHRNMGSFDTQHGSNSYQKQLNSVTQNRNMGSLDTQHGSNSYQMNSMPFHNSLNNSLEHGSLVTHYGSLSSFCGSDRQSGSYQTRSQFYFLGRAQSEDCSPLYSFGGGRSADYQASMISHAADTGSFQPGDTPGACHMLPESHNRSCGWESPTKPRTTSPTASPNGSHILDKTGPQHISAEHMAERLSLSRSALVCESYKSGDEPHYRHCFFGRTESILAPLTIPSHPVHLADEPGSRAQGEACKITETQIYSIQNSIKTCSKPSLKDSKPSKTTKGIISTQEVHVAMNSPHEATNTTMPFKLEPNHEKNDADSKNSPIPLSTGFPTLTSKTAKDISQSTLGSSEIGIGAKMKIISRNSKSSPRKPKERKDDREQTPSHPSGILTVSSHRESFQHSTGADKTCIKENDPRTECTSSSRSWRQEFEVSDISGASTGPMEAVSSSVPACDEKRNTPPLGNVSRVEGDIGIPVVSGKTAAAALTNSDRKDTKPPANSDPEKVKVPVHDNREDARTLANSDQKDSTSVADKNEIEVTVSSNGDQQDSASLADSNQIEVTLSSNGDQQDSASLADRHQIEVTESANSDQQDTITPIQSDPRDATSLVSSHQKEVTAASKSDHRNSLARVNNDKTHSTTYLNNDQRGSIARVNNDQMGAEARVNNAQRDAIPRVNNDQRCAAARVNNDQMGAAAVVNNDQRGAAAGVNNDQRGAAAIVNNDHRGAAARGNGYERQNWETPANEILCIRDVPYKRYYAAYLCVAEADLERIGVRFHRELEGWGFRILLPVRDLLAAGFHLDNICRALEERCQGKIIIVLSRNFQASAECRFITHYARSLDPDLQKRNLIPVMFGNDRRVLPPPILSGVIVIHYEHNTRRGWLKKRIADAIFA